jgi:hypothetical protein
LTTLVLVRVVRTIAVRGYDVLVIVVRLWPPALSDEEVPLMAV